MKVAIDISPLKSGHRFRGIGIYTQNLTKALKKIKKPKLKIELIEKGENIEQTDLVHYPYFDLFFPTLPLQRSVPAVVTIHDVTPLVFPKHYPPGIKGKINFYRQRRALRTVQAVICDSKNSQKDIRRFLGYPEENIFVVYLAPGEIFKPITDKRLLALVRKKYSLPERFVLYVGGVNYNKNVLGLVVACQEAKIPLVIVNQQAATADFDWSHPENQSLVQLIKDYSKNPNIIRLGLLTDEELVSVYNLATVYCQPSFYEGFGLPVLEAMRCDCPVVASNTSSLPEVVGDAGVLVDPWQSAALAKGLKSVLDNFQKQKELVRKGRKQVAKFSWQKTARATLKVYEKVSRN